MRRRLTRIRARRQPSFVLDRRAAQRDQGPDRPVKGRWRRFKPRAMSAGISTCPCVQAHRPHAHGLKLRGSHLPPVHALPKLGEQWDLDPAGRGTVAQDREAVRRAEGEAARDAPGNPGIRTLVSPKRQLVQRQVRVKRRATATRPRDLPIVSTAALKGTKPSAA